MVQYMLIVKGTGRKWGNFEKEIISKILILNKKKLYPFEAFNYLLYF